MVVHVAEMVRLLRTAVKACARADFSVCLRGVLAHGKIWK